MKRTISIKLLPTPEQALQLSAMQQAFASACNDIVPFAIANKCSNRVALHHLCYYKIRETLPSIGSQMVCNAIHKVVIAYKSLFAHKPKLRKEEWPKISFKNKSVQYDNRMYSIKGNMLSLFTLDGRVKIKMRIGVFQQEYLSDGKAMGAELVTKKGRWYFNIVLELPDMESKDEGEVLGVDIGENNLAATSTGKLFGGRQLSHERDKYLHLRSRLQSNGSKSAKRRLKAVSGRESRHVKHVNHEVSKSIVAEAMKNRCTTIAMEDLTGIMKHVRARRKTRSRLHRWAFRQLQTFIEYKAEAAGIKVVYVNPAYTSQTCAACGEKGLRTKHRFSCQSCGRLAHADLNASLNIASLARTAVLATGVVNHPRRPVNSRAEGFAL